MNARFIAILLSLFISSTAIHAASQDLGHHSLVTHKIDLNKANASTLTGSFKGIGKKRAEAIIAYRDTHHGFKSIEELAEIKGLGQHFVERNREKLYETFTMSQLN